MKTTCDCDDTYRRQPHLSRRSLSDRCSRRLVHWCGLVLERHQLPPCVHPGEATAH